MLLSRTLRYMPAQVMGPVAQFAAVVVWTHLLPPGAFGTVALIMALQELVFQLCLAWWSAYVLRYAATIGLGERTSQAAHENAALLVSTLLQVGVTWLILELGETPLTPGLVGAAVAYTVSRCLTTHIAERARAAQAIGIYTIAQTAGPVLGLALAVAFAMQAPSATAVLAGFATAQVAVLPLLWRAVIPSRSVSLDWAITRRAIAFSLPLVISGAIGWATVNGIRVIVEHMQGAAAVGLLSVGWGLGQRLLSVAAMLVTAAAFPIAVERMVQGGPAAGYAQVARNGILVLAVTVPATAGIVWLTPPLVDLFIGTDFRAVTIAILPIAAVAAAIRNIRVHCADQVFLLAEKPGFLLVVNTVEAVATLAACALGLMLDGLVGACIGCLIGSALGFALCFGGAIREGFRFPTVDFLRIAAATGMMLCALALAPIQLARIELALAVLGGGSVYLAAMALLFQEHWRGNWPLRRRPA